MRTTKLVSIVLLSTMLELLIGCSPQVRIAGNYQYKTECLGVEGDGTQTLKAWGSGRNRFDAFDQALKNAIFDVLFKGITDGKSECEMRPLVPEVNARQKYETYFDKFFQDGGEYKKYISMRDEQIEHIVNRERKEGIGTVTHSAIVIVKRPQLKAKLIADGILNQQ